MTSRMLSLTIDTTPVTAEPGTTILQAATRAGIDIPSLCSYEGIEAPTSCFVCAVRIEGRKGVVPSCAAPVENGLIVDASSSYIREYRKNALELLLSEHAGDCEAPCRRICPCGMDIPSMIRALLHDNYAHALRVIKEDMPFPAVLGYICPAPCQKGCRRTKVDATVQIRDLHRRVAEHHLGLHTQAPRPMSPCSDKSVGIVGAGPAGLSAGWYLALRGHHCTLYEQAPRPGGMLAFGIPHEKLPQEILDKEVSLVEQIGVTFRLSTTVGKEVSLEELENSHDAVVLAIGETEPQRVAALNIDMGTKGIAVQPGTFLTSRARVFACGAAITPGKLAVRSMGQGHSVALVIDRFLRHDTSPTPQPRAFDSRITALSDTELTDLTSAHTTRNMEESSEKTLSDMEKEAGRCLECDCTAKTDCGLRDYATEYGAGQGRYRTGQRRGIRIVPVDKNVIYEPGKCILCGRCVHLTATSENKTGLSFVNRGFETLVEAPLARTMTEAMGKAAGKCIGACPTGALTRRPTRSSAGNPDTFSGAAS